MISNTNTIKYFRLKIAGVVFHALFLTLITIGLQYVSFVRADELAFFKVFSVVKDLLTPKNVKPLAGHIIFLDVSKDLQLADDSTNTGYDGKDGLAGAKIVITDRSKLAKFFSIVNQHKGGYRFILCDVNFEIRAPNDSGLKASIERTQKLIVSANIQGSQLIPPIFKVDYGGVTYQASSGYFAKLPIFYNDSLKSLPALMAERINGKRFSRSHGINLENGYPAFNTVIPELYYRTNDLVSQTGSHGANFFYLGEVINNKDFFNKYLKDKVIIIGNFSTDLHKSFLGNMPGSLILLDAYLSLANNSLQIRWEWSLFLFALYLVISYFIFLKPEVKLEKLHGKIKVKMLSGLVKTYITYIGVLIIADLLSYLFFQILISLFYIASYLTILELALEKWGNYQKSPGLMKFLKEELL